MWKSTPHLLDKEFLNEVLVKSFRTRTPTQSQHNTFEKGTQFHLVFQIYVIVRLGHKYAKQKVLPHLIKKGFAQKFMGCVYGHHMVTINNIVTSNFSIFWATFECFWLLSFFSFGNFFHNFFSFFLFIFKWDIKKEMLTSTA